MPQEVRNAYKLLGVISTISDNELKKRYHELSKKYHPDYGQESGQMQQRINDAYGLITDYRKNKKKTVSSNTEDNSVFSDFKEKSYYENLMKEQGLDEGIVIHMDIDQNLALKRSLDRLICSSCGASYNKSVPALSPKIDGFCDKCGHTLATRSDDSEETFNARFVTYVKEATPIAIITKAKAFEIPKSVLSTPEGVVELVEVVVDFAFVEV